MKISGHKSNTRVLNPPKGYKIEDHRELHIHAAPVTDLTIDDKPVILTFWKPSEDELQKLVAGGLVAVFVVGTTMPPLSLAVQP